MLGGFSLDGFSNEIILPTTVILSPNFNRLRIRILGDLIRKLVNFDILTLATYRATIVFTVTIVLRLSVSEVTILTVRLFHGFLIAINVCHLPLVS
jgi:hypothetical protein